MKLTLRQQLTEALEENQRLRSELAAWAEKYNELQRLAQERVTELNNRLEEIHDKP